MFVAKESTRAYLNHWLIAFGETSWDNILQDGRLLWNPDTMNASPVPMIRLVSLRSGDPVHKMQKGVCDLTPLQDDPLWKLYRIESVEDHDLYRNADQHCYAKDTPMPFLHDRKAIPDCPDIFSNLLTHLPVCLW